MCKYCLRDEHSVYCPESTGLYPVLADEFPDGLECKDCDVPVEVFVKYKVTTGAYFLLCLGCAANRSMEKLSS